MKIHFISMDGNPMHNLTLVLHHQGNTVSVSDEAVQEASEFPEGKNKLWPREPGWFPEKITADLDAVILGKHVKLDNPELQKAQKLGLSIFSFSEFLVERTKNKTRVVVAGFLGKKTITSMVLQVLKYHQVDVDFVLGAPLEGLETSVHLTEENDFIILEADESLSSPINKPMEIQRYKPNIALLSGISLEHKNLFPSLESYLDQFREFIDSIVKGGILVYNEEDPNLKKLVEENTNSIRKHPYKTAPHEVLDGNTFLKTPEGDMPILISGKHNLSNIAGAKWICQHMGIDEDDFYESISTFSDASNVKS